MYRLGVRRSFDAAHLIEGHSGKCSRLHGHTWWVEAVLRQREIGPGGMVVDFEAAEKALEEAVSPFDHSFLNELEQFKDVQPTAENLARVIFTGLLEIFEASGLGNLDSVTVWESSDAWARFESD